MCNIRIRVKKIIKINCTARNLISTIIGCVGIVICCMLAAKVIENQIYLILVSVIVSGLVYAVVLILMKNTVITDIWSVLSEEQEAKGEEKCREKEIQQWTL